MTTKMENIVSAIWRIGVIVLIAVFSGLLVYRDECAQRRISRLEELLLGSSGGGDLLSPRPRVRIRQRDDLIPGLVLDRLGEEKMLSAEAGLDRDLSDGWEEEDFEEGGVYEGEEEEEGEETNDSQPVERLKRSIVRSRPNILKKKTKQMKNAHRMRRIDHRLVSEKNADRRQRLVVRRRRPIHFLVNRKEEKPTLISWKLSNDTTDMRNFNLSADGQQISVKAGWYFVYFQVYLYTKAPYSFLELMVDGRAAFKCISSVDAVTENENSPKHKTCYAGAVCHVVTDGDVISVRNSHNTSIGRDELATFIGFVPL